MRLQAGIEAWTNALEGSGEKYDDDEDTMDTHEAKAAYKLGGMYHSRPENLKKSKPKKLVKLYKTNFTKFFF